MNDSIQEHDRLQEAKTLVRAFQQGCDQSEAAELAKTYRSFIAGDYRWRGSFPFYEYASAEEVCECFWQPLRQSLTALRRRPDIFLAGYNDAEEGQEADQRQEEQDVWVCQMGHFMGLFDAPWLDIPHSGKIAFLRYAEFHRVMDKRIAESALFIDLADFMAQAPAGPNGCNPFAQQTGASFLYPGPETHDGLLYAPQPAAEGRKTIALINAMCEDLRQLNISSTDNCPPEYLAQTWSDEMIWYGPRGIGASYTIERYQRQHQFPFREGLSDKVFCGHVCRIAEGSYGAFFGWPNLTNTPKGNFLGMPAGRNAEMRVVDVYRRSGDKLAENWVIIDLPHYFAQQGLDVLARMRAVNGSKT